MAVEKVFENNTWKNVAAPVIGTFTQQENKTDRTLSSGWQILYSASLTPGVYLIQGQLTIAPTAQSYFSIHIADTSEATYDSFYIGRTATTCFSGSGQYGANVTALVNVPSTRTYSLVAWIGTAGTNTHKGSKFAYIKLQ